MIFQRSDFFRLFWRGLRDTVSGPDETHIQVLHQPDLSANSFLHRFERCFIIQMYDDFSPNSNKNES